MNEEQMAPEQRQGVDDRTESNSAVSTADLASAGERQEQEQEEQEEENVGMQPRSPGQGAQAAQPNEQSDAMADETEEEAERTPVMSDDAAEDYRTRWQTTQADFVNDPRSAVAAADALVAEVMKRVAEEFAHERDGLERQWKEGGEASTEDLRVAFQRYRSFFSRLLSL
jgi:hypothetical protein